jgi:hypothetical protein
MLAAAVLAAAPFMKANAQAFTENFDNITTLTGSGWFMQNNCTPVGAIPNWFQGTNVAASGPFDAYNGAANAYIAANYNFATGANDISGWLVTPNRTFRNGDVISFYTRSTNSQWSDRLQVRLSTNGASTNVGTGTAGVGDFTTQLLEINPTQVQGPYANAWTLYTITISGLPAPTSGRIAFRYYVTSGGPSGADSDYIGIDNVVYTPYTCPSFTMTPSGALTGGAAGQPYSTSLTQTGALGAPSYAVTAGALPPGLTLSSAGAITGTPTATGTFNFTVTVSDNSGCSGSSAYSITTVCGPNPTSLNGLPALCDNGTPYSLTQGSPAGGSYSGTGVTAGSFDPAAGTQTITYDYTDPYGCAYSTSNTITVNTAPSVMQDPIADMCDNGAPAMLSGGSPAGGMYSGTGVSANMFDPSAGTQTVTYSYTDGNGCMNVASTTITVNAAPAVTHSDAATCDNDGLLALSGGSPAGGTYSGTGVTGTDFDPASGTQTLNYSYTDANGCMNDADFMVTVNAAPAVTQTPFTAVCEDAADQALTGGSPAGGMYSGTGVTGSSFDPSVGTQMIMYTYTDANGCTNEAMESFTVNTLPNVFIMTSNTDWCVYDPAGPISGGSPAGGTYSGTGVSGGNFDPATAGLGTHTITYTFTDANGCTNDGTIDFDVDACLGIEENVNDLYVAFPNPGKGDFMIQLTAGQLTNIVVTDAQGKIVAAPVSAQADGVKVDLTAAQNGLYFVKGQLGGTPVSIQLIKQ